MRDSTERPETVTIGTNELVGTNPLGLIPFFDKLKNDKWKDSAIPALWDGNTSVRIITRLIELYAVDYSVKASLNALKNRKMTPEFATFSESNQSIGL
jgi:UDP-N-acetylglucosamine 2-epimerase